MSKIDTFAKIASKFIKIVCPQEDTAPVDINTLINKVIDKKPLRRLNTNYWPSAVNNPYNCDRRQVFARTEEIWTNATRENPEKIREMDIGTALHKLFGNYLALTGYLYGHWRCPSCLLVAHLFSRYPTHYCPNTVTITASDWPTEQRICATFQRKKHDRGEPIWDYEEVKVFDSLGFSGRQDGILVMPGDRRWFTCELKTVRDTVFRDLVETKLTDRLVPNLPPEFKNFPMLVEAYTSLPRAYHITQAAICSELLVQMTKQNPNLTGLDAHKYGGTLIIYVNRNTGQLRTFFRRNTAAEYRRGRETVIATELAVKKARALEKNQQRDFIVNTVPANCSTRTDEKALLCPWRLVCFPYKKLSKNKVTFLQE